MDHRHKCKTKSIKLLKENVGENLSGFSNEFLDSTKVKFIKEQTYIFNFIKIKY